MANHDSYGKTLLDRVTGGRCSFYGPPVETNHGVGGACRIDGAVGDIAIEVESRTAKQVRGAILDLILHRFPKKLLILLPVHMNVRIERDRCAAILHRFCAEEDFQVIALSGHAENPHFETDAHLISYALTALGFEERPPTAAQAASGA